MEYNICAYDDKTFEYDFRTHLTPKLSNQDKVCIW
jgi:hypothetical protein